MSDFQIDIQQIEALATVSYQARLKAKQIKHQISPKKINRIKYSCEKVPKRTCKSNFQAEHLEK